MSTEIAVCPIEEKVAPREPREPASTGVRLIVCVVLAVAAVLVHGYHPFAVDGSLYVPAVKKLLHPELYPQDSEFFLFPAQLSIFAQLIAASVRLTSVPLEYVLLFWHSASIAVLLASCWRLGRRLFDDERHAVFGVLLIASVLTIPVAGTSLMLVDPYLTSRSLSTPAILMMICCVLERRFARAAAWFVAALLVHPLMAGFGAGFAITLHAVRERNWRLLAAVGAGSSLLFAIGIFWARTVQVTTQYRAAVLTRSYFFVSRWEWYEVVGLIAPLILFAVMLWYRRSQQEADLASCLFTAILFGSFFCLLALFIDRSPELLPMAKFQPLRAFHLLYILMFLLPVNAFVVSVTRHRPGIAFALIPVIACVMFFVQQQTFPASAHVEWPWSTPSNQWVEAFEWVRSNTPKDAVFALDGEYTEARGEDCQGFSALAERSSLADVSKDGGVAALFPSVAPQWAREAQITSRVAHFAREDNLDALAKAGASWVLLPAGNAESFDCAYRNATVAVCRLSNNPTFLAGHARDEKLARLGAITPTARR